jgi:murein L,D-transpeptidase YafK
MLAKNAAQAAIPVYIFPFRMNENNMSKFTKKYAGKKELLVFWRNLKEGYDIFLDTKTELKFAVKKGGSYIFEKL